MKTLRNLVCIGIGVLASVFNVHAAPYASGCTNTGGGVIQYYLNATPASGTVTLTTYPSHTVTTPAAAQGQNTFTLPGGDTSYTIAVTQIGSGSPSQQSILSASQINTNWASPDPRGLAVSTSPTNGSIFGTVYVASSAVGSTHGKGLFAFHSDMSVAFGQTTAGSYGTTWTAGGTSGPFKISVSTVDGSVWANDETSADSCVWQCDPYLQAANAPLQILAGIGANVPVHGQEYGKSLATGSLANGNLVLYTFDITMPSVASNSLGGSAGGIGYNSAYFDSTMEWSLANPGAQITAPPGSTGGPSYNCLYRYTIGSGPLPWGNAPDLCVAEGLNILGLVGDMDVAPDGKLFTIAERISPGSAQYLNVYDPSGVTNLFCSASSSSDDKIYDQVLATGYPLSEEAPYSVKVSPDDRYVALYGIFGYVAVYSLTNGVPDITTFTFIPNLPQALDGREIGWDAADNVYGLSSGTGALNIFDLGRTITCVTSNDITGLHGSFTSAAPSVTASVVATTPQAYQANNSYALNGATPTPAVFTISLNAPQAGATVINYALSGTATNGVNYIATPSATTVTFPAGVTNETVTITPTAIPASGPSLSVIINVQGSSSYSAVAPSSATASIASSGAQVLTIGTLTYPTMYRGTPGDYAAFQILRYGDTNAPAYTIPSTAFSYSGAAVEGVDYTTPVPSINVNTGDTNEIATNGSPQLTPPGTFPFKYVGNESVIVTIAGATGYSVVAPTSATMTLLDNADPPETVLWSDPLTDPTDTGWNLAFGSVANGIASAPVVTYLQNITGANDGTDAAHDYQVDFGYNVLGSGIVTANPPSGAATALHVTVNKVGGITYNGNATPGATGGVSLYPAGPTGTPLQFSGNFALRFSELTYEDGGGSATESTQWGINHIGTNANWWAGNATGGAGNTNIDGVWYSLTCDQGGASFGDVLEFTSSALPNMGWVNIGNKSWGGFAANFKHPPYKSTGTGAFSDGGGNNPAALWNDVEVKQYNNVVTLTINKTVIFTYTNTSGLWKSGDVMLGYCDPFDSIGSLGQAFFSNARVVSLAGPTITSVGMSGGNIVINFTSPDADAAPSSFSVFGSATVNGAYSAATATITQSGNVYTATTAYNAGAAAQYFLIKQTNEIQ